MDTLIELMEFAVATHGDRVALVMKPGFRTRSWTFSDIGHAVPRVARRLRDAGVEPGDRVLVWAPSRPEWGIASLGVLWAGGSIVPLDFRSTDDFAMKIAEQVRPTLVLASAQTKTAAQRLELKTLTVEALVDRASDDAPLERPTVAGDDLAAIVFTSGTTGEPKGVMLSHRNLASNAESIRSVIPLGPETRLLSIPPLSHLYGFNPGFLAPMIAGARVVFPSSLQSMALARAFREQHVTLLEAVPQVVKLLTNAIERQVDATGRRALFERLHAVAPYLPVWARRLLFRPVLARLGGALRIFTVGGAAMNPNVARRWEDRGVMSLQGYGTTETSPAISFTRMDRNRMGTVGEVIPGVEVRIAPDDEILVRGPNVFKGYWERPDATAAVLVDGWYHTGDHGSLDSEGILTLHGRKKDMIVLADGQKVHPIDVEQILIRDPRVKDAAVVGIERPESAVEVHAALILDEGADGDAVVREANAQLGAHQRIRAWTRWPAPEFPRNHLLKVRKTEVADWILSSGAAVPSTVSALALAAASAVERLLGQMEDVPRDAIGPDARLASDLGLDSLGRVELLSRIEEELGIYLDESQVEPDGTVAELQARLDAAPATVEAPEDIYAWPLHPVVGAVRTGIQDWLLRPGISLLYRRHVSGLEHLEGLRGPVLFTPNHHLHSDNPLIITAIPPRFRHRLTVAASARHIFGNRLQGFAAALLGNAFPLAREGEVRRSLDLLGARLDRGYNVLLYPEGKLTVGGPLQEFMPGVGIVAIHGRTPVVPVWLDVRRGSAFERDVASRAIRGEVEVIFGRPLHFDIEDDPADVTRRIRDAVLALAPATIHAPRSARPIGADAMAAGHR